VVVGALEQVGGAAERSDHAREGLGRCARLERRPGSPSSPFRRSSCSQSPKRDLEQARVARRAGEVVDRLAHLDGVARRAAQHAVHVGQQRRGGQAVARGDLDDRLRQLAGLVELGQEGARADLDVHHERVEPGGELLGEDRGDDERDRLDRAGGVADGVEPLSAGARSPVWPMIAQPASRTVATKRSRSRRRVVAGDRVELVERAAGVAQPAPGDHRHRAAAGGDDRRQQQRDLVADAAGRVLVDDWAGRGPRSAPRPSASSRRSARRARRRACP
jgi:hypothetical protein